MSLRSLSFSRRRAILFLIDVGLLSISYVLAHLIRVDAVQPSAGAVVWASFRITAVGFVLMKAAVFVLGGSYRGLAEHASIGDLLVIVRNSTLATLAGLFVVTFFFDVRGYSRGILVIDWMITVGLLAASRVAWRLGREGAFDFSRPASHKRVLVVGAGRAGATFTKNLIATFRRNVAVVGFLDDDPDKQGSSLLGRPILGSTADLPEVIRRHNVDQVVVAIPSASPRDVRRIADLAHGAAEFRVIPSLDAILSGRVPITQTLAVAPEAFLPRERVELAAVEQFFSGKVVLVTGAGGSIGGELARQLSRYELGRVERLILLDSAETPLYDIERNARAALGSRVVPVLASVRDAGAMDAVLRAHRPHVILHAAALKHVPLSELHPLEAIHTNTVATARLAEQAAAHGAEYFVLVSTDKAVAPSSIMGASKRAAEVCVRALSGGPGQTRYVMVRFGNVLGSSGSVLPLFHEQIGRGGPVTVTDDRMTRFFMTIPEACGLILHATRLAQGGEIYVLEMGQPVRILDLAHNLIRLYGYEPGRDIEVKITGLRPGEKLHESLFDEGETSEPSAHPKILRVQGPTVVRAREQLQRLEAAIAARDEAAALEIVRRLVPTYAPTADVPAAPETVAVAARR